MSFDVVCIGGASIDITVGPVETNDAFAKLVNFVDGITVCVGGDALNESLTLAKLGHSTALVTCVGDDPLGRVLVSEIEKCGVDSSLVYIDDSVSTTGIVCLTGEKDRRNFFFEKRSAINRLDIDCVNLQIVKQAKIMTFGSLLSCDGFSQDSLIKLFRTAKESSVVTVADVAVMDESLQNMEMIKPVLPYIDYIFPNYDEACSITEKKEPEEIIDIFLALGVKNVILKLGSGGCLAKGAFGSAKIHVYHVPVVNTTGAGDNFLAGFVSGILSGLTLSECLIRASAAAAITIQNIGASTGVKNMEQVLEFIRKNERPVFEKEGN